MTGQNRRMRRHDAAKHRGRLRHCQALRATGERGGARSHQQAPAAQRHAPPMSLLRNRCSAKVRTSMSAVVNRGIVTTVAGISSPSRPSGRAGVGSFPRMEALPALLLINLTTPPEEPAAGRTPFARLPEYSPNTGRDKSSRGPLCQRRARQRNPRAQAGRIVLEFQFAAVEPRHRGDEAQTQSGPRPRAALLQADKAIDHARAVACGIPGPRSLTVRTT